MIQTYDFSSIEFQKLFQLSDEDYKQIRSRVAGTRIAERARQQITAYYQGVNKNGIIRFLTPSGTTPGLFWLQQIKLLTLKTNLKVKKITDFEKVRRSIQSDIAIYCNDPSFLYWGHQYIAYRNGFGIKPEDRVPNKRNPLLVGGTCKHLEGVLKVLPFHVGVLVRDMRKKGIL